MPSFARTPRRPAGRPAPPLDNPGHRQDAAASPSSAQPRIQRRTPGATPRVDRRVWPRRHPPRTDARHSPLPEAAAARRREGVPRMHRSGSCAALLGALVVGSALVACGFAGPPPTPPCSPRPARPARAGPRRNLPNLPGSRPLRLAARRLRPPPRPRRGAPPRRLPVPPPPLPGPTRHPPPPRPAPPPRAPPTRRPRPAGPPPGPPTRCPSPW